MKTKRTLIFFLAAALFTTGQAQQAGLELSHTLAGQSVLAYLKAFNDGEQTMRDYFAAHLAKDALQKTPMEMRLDRYRQMRDRIGSLEIQRVNQARDGSVSLLARGSKGPLLQLEFEFEPVEPFGLLGIRVQDAGEGGPPPDPKKNNADLVATVKAFVQKAAAAEEFSGVVLVAQNGAPLFEEAYGFADRDKKIPNRVATKFNIGSMNKSFTKLAVTQLVAENKVGLDDPVKKYLPDYPNPEAAAKVTVRHLLDMTSGIGDFFGDRYEATPKEKIRSLRDYLPLFADKPLEFEPGTKNQYSNGGYIVLGLIVEKASGIDYYTYVREHIYKPAGMTDSDSYDKDAVVPNRATGYVRDGSAWRTNFATLPGKGSSAGGGYSTVRDLFKYWMAWKDGKLGGANEETRNPLAIAGGAPGLNATLIWEPNSAYAIIVVSNFDPPSATRLAQQIRAWLPR
jgi:CubicO group peptidase (beta-lactamase class C family)